jgi:iron complex outermembrane receptor protein
MTVYDIPAQYEQPSYHKTDLSLTYTNSEGTWYFQVFGKNLEDEVTVTYMGPGGNSFTPGDPRTYGARVGLWF